MLSLLVISCLCLSGGLGGAPGEPNLREAFPLGVYWPWERTGPLAERNGLDKWDFVARELNQLRADGVTDLWVVNLGVPELPRLGEELAARGMRLVAALAELDYKPEWRRRNWEYLGKHAQAAIASVGDTPAVLAWGLCDEPRTAYLEEIETFRQKMARWDPGRPSVVVTMWHDTPAAAEKTNLPALCTDLYPFFSKGNPNGPNPAPRSRQWYFANCQRTAQLAAEKDIPAWVMPQAYAEVWGPWRYDEQGDLVALPKAFLHWRPPTVGEIRWQIWSALAAGMQGFYFFVYLPSPREAATAKPYQGPIFPEEIRLQEETPLHFPGALIAPNRRRTPQYEAMVETYRALRPLIPLLKPTRPAPLPEEVKAEGARLGLLSGPKGTRYLLVVNEDTEHEREIRVTLPPEVQQVRNLRTGEVLTSGPARTVRLELRPGEGTVLGLKGQ